VSDERTATEAPLLVLLGIPGRGLRPPADPGYLEGKNHHRPGRGWAKSLIPAFPAGFHKSPFPGIP